MGCHAENVQAGNNSRIENMEATVVNVQATVADNNTRTESVQAENNSRIENVATTVVNVQATVAENTARMENVEATVVNVQATVTTAIHTTYNSISTHL